MIEKNYRTYGDYIFDYQWDKGGDPDYPILIWVRELGNPENVVGKRYFEKNSSKQHIHNFMKKIARSKDYRKKWSIIESDEQQKRNEIKELKRINHSLLETIVIYENTIKGNDDLKNLFIEEISKDNFKGDFMQAPLQIKRKKTIVGILNEK